LSRRNIEADTIGAVVVMINLFNGCAKSTFSGGCGLASAIAQIGVVAISQAVHREKLSNQRYRVGCGRAHGERDGTHR
jgi:hypothetical protein